MTARLLLHGRENRFRQGRPSKPLAGVGALTLLAFAAAVAALYLPDGWL